MSKSVLRILSATFIVALGFSTMASSFAKDVTTATSKPIMIVKPSPIVSAVKK